MERGYCVILIGLWVWNLETLERIIGWLVGERGGKILSTVGGVTRGEDKGRRFR